MRRRGLVAIVLATPLLLAGSVAAGASLNTTITSGPSGLIASRTATFRFKATVPGAAFRCKLDGAAWSTCASPKSYSRLSQGAHTFRVKATKNGSVDRTPATRTFTVDTVKPQTTIASDARTRIYMVEDFEASFSSNEDATFKCRLDNDAFTPCTDPRTIPVSELATDHIYTFEVRARDAAGNVDATPASHQFGTVPQMPFDQATGEAAAALYVPDQEVMDATASCGGSTEIDCDNGQPLPPSDQISVAATRSVLTVTNADRYDVSATLTIKTVAPIKVKVFGATCDLTFDSANGTSSTWGMVFQMPKQAMTSGEFSLAPYGEVFLAASNHSLSRVESADYALSGNIVCAQADAFFPASALAETITGMLAERMRYLCMAPGPALFETCPWVPY